MKFICIKPIADEQNIICMVNDVVKFVEQDKDGQGVQVEGQKGWCTGIELSFDNIEFVTHFHYFKE
jgi:hypothetical protein